MTTVKNKQAFNKLVKARTILLVSNPFFGCLALHLEPVEIVDPEHAAKIWGSVEGATMAVDGYHMYYHPDFVLSLSEPELTGVVAHEVLHCAFQHMTRRQNRDPRQFNIAGDFSINDDIKKADLTLPGPAVGVASPPGTKGHLHDPQFANMSTEEIYERLKQQAEKKGGQGKDGKGKITLDPGRCGGVLDTAAKSDPAKTEEVRRDWEGNVRLAVNVARAANAGKVPGYLERLVKQLAKPKVSWRDLTRQFIDQSMTKDFSYARPNRRALSHGMVLPGYIPDALHHMIFIADVSGSVSIDLMKAMVSEVAGALDEGTADHLTVLYADTHVRHVDEYVPGDLVQAKVIAGGGTSFVDALNWVNKHAPDAACCVYLTDMMPDHWNLPEVNMPVLWAAYCAEQYLNGIKVPYGQVVHVDGSQ